MILTSTKGREESMTDKWVEVNIHLNSYSRTNEVIATTVRRFVDELRTKDWIKSWHFFREPQIRLRFLGEDENIKEVKRYLESELELLERTRGDLYSCHVFGCHGVRDKEYVGEADNWKGDWQLVTKIWENTSEFTMRLIEKPERPLEYHGERHVHLLLNQLGLDHLYCDTGTEMIIQYRRHKAPGE
jgi:hypothetical protein